MKRPIRTSQVVYSTIAVVVLAFMMQKGSNFILLLPIVHAFCPNLRSCYRYTSRRMPICPLPAAAAVEKRPRARLANTVGPMEARNDDCVSNLPLATTDTSRHKFDQKAAESSSMTLRTTIDEDNDNVCSSFTRRHTITWQTQSGTVTFEAHDGELLRTACLKRGNVVSPHNGRANLINCRGLGTCGTCAVHILEGRVWPVERNSVETLRLSLPPHNNSSSSSSSLRLACQVQVKGDLTVTKRTGFWGQNTDESSIAEGSVPTKPFGEWEFLLDRKSPPPPT